MVSARDARSRFLRQQRARRLTDVHGLDAAADDETTSTTSNHEGDPDVVERVAAMSLADRMLDCAHDAFERVCVVGTGRCAELTCEAVASKVSAHKRVSSIHVIGDDEKARELCVAAVRDASKGSVEATHAHGDVEQPPLARGDDYDAVLFPLVLHWCNRPDNALSTAREALQPDGLMLAAVLGGNTLASLRRACVLAELERRGGVAPRVSPSIRMRDAGNLLGATGFDTPAADAEKVRLRYPDAFALVEHLRYMGGTSAASQTTALTRDVALAAAAMASADSSNDDGSVDEEFEILYLTGWSGGNGGGGGCGGGDDAGSRRAVQRGSATMSLADLARELGTPP
ncbi:methyltransferase [Pseudoscourfieldia marina]